MANKTVVNNAGGIGFIGALTLVFITLKLTSVIDWGWEWVLSPLWIAVLVWLFIMALAFGILSIITKNM